MDALTAPARRSLLRVLTGLAGWALAGARAAPDGGPTEVRVKAAFLYKFTGYVEWPSTAFASAEAPFQIGVVGSEDVVDALMEFTQGRRVNERLVVVKKLRPGESVAGLHLLFVTRDQPLTNLPPQPGLLLVTEAEGALEHGSVINFLVEDRRVRFEIALDAAARRELRVSSRMLAVASRVQGAGSAP